MNEKGCDNLMVLMKGRPIDIENRLKKEIKVYDLLDSLSIEYMRVDHESAMTMEDCVKIEEELDAAICKNLFLVNSNKSQYYLLMLLGHKKFKTKDISKQIHSSRLSFASDDKMLEYLDITPGAVSVIGLINDTDCHVQLIVDEDILKEEYIGFHPCINTTSMKIKTKDLFEKVLPSIKHDYYIIQC